MHSLIYIEVSKQINFSYQKEFISGLKETLPDLEVFDLDNHSEASLFNYAVDLMRRSEKCVLLIKVEPDASIGRAMIVIEEVLKIKDKCYVLVQGQNSMMEKISRPLNKVDWLQNLSALTTLVSNFFKNGQ